MRMSLGLKKSLKIIYFSKILLSAFCILDIILGAEDTASKQKTWSLHLWREGTKIQISE